MYQVNERNEEKQQETTGRMCKRSETKINPIGIRNISDLD